MCLERAIQKGGESPAPSLEFPASGPDPSPRPFAVLCLEAAAAAPPSLAQGVYASDPLPYAVPPRPGLKIKTVTELPGGSSDDLRGRWASGKFHSRSTRETCLPELSLLLRQRQSFSLRLSGPRSFKLLRRGFSCSLSVGFESYALSFEVPPSRFSKLCHTRFGPYRGKFPAGGRPCVPLFRVTLFPPFALFARPFYLLGQAPLSVSLGNDSRYPQLLG